MNGHDKQAAATAYLACAIWTIPEDEPQNPEPSEQARAHASAAIESFVTRAFGLAEEAIERPGYDAARLGHDLWLTRNGHGAGFWDRDELDDPDLGPSLGDALTACAEQMGARDAYAGDDGLIYIDGDEA